MKEVYFQYTQATILKETIKEKVLRIEAENPNVKICGHIIVHPQFLCTMYYRYYYIISVICKYKNVEKSVNFCRPIEEVYDSLDDLMSKNEKPNLKCIDEDWVKKEVRKANLQQDAFTLNHNLDIVPVHLEMPIIRYA